MSGQYVHFAIPQISVRKRRQIVVVDERFVGTGDHRDGGGIRRDDVALIGAAAGHGRFHHQAPCASVGAAHRRFEKRCRRAGGFQRVGADIRIAELLFASEIHVWMRSKSRGEIGVVVAHRRRAGDRQSGDVEVARQQFDTHVTAE